MAESNSNQNKTTSESSYEEKVRKIAEQVWKLWQKDLRNERERRGKKGR